MDQEPGAFTTQQARAAAGALLLPTQQDSGPMLACPVCAAAAIRERTRRRLYPFASLRCPKCQTRLRPRYGRLLFISFLALLVLLIVDEFGLVPGLPRMPAGVAVSWNALVFVLYNAWSVRLPLVPAP
jgi:hypothetical protein